MSGAGSGVKRFWLRLWAIGDPLFWEIFGTVLVAYAFTRLLLD